MMDTLGWEKAMKRQQVILRAFQGSLTWVQAAEILGISDRQVRRLRKKYNKSDIKSLLDARRGPARNKIPTEFVDKICSLYRDQYFDFNVRHFYEKLVDEHQFKHCYSWLLYTLQKAKLVDYRTVHRLTTPHFQTSII